MEVGIPQSLSALEKFLPTSRLSLESLDVKLASTAQFNDKDDEGEIMLLAMILLQLHGVKLPSSSSTSSTTLEEESDLANKKKRQRTSPDQLAILEQIFQTDKMPNPQTRGQLADQLGMSSRRVQIWFQNKRAKVKRSSMKNDGECSSPSSLGDSSSSITAPESPSSPLDSSDSSSPSPQSPSTPQTATTTISVTVTNAISPVSKSTPSLTVFTSTTPSSNDTILADTTKQLKAQQQQFSLKAPFVETQPLLAASY